MPNLDEFSLIARLFAPLAVRHPGALGLTDDAALIDGPDGRQWAITADAMVAGVHFLPDDPPELIARKLIRVNLSDLAAMGAKPFAILLASCFPKEVGENWLERFASGLKTDCDEYGIALIGGDTVATPGPLTLALTAIGDLAAESALLRSNARSGDDIWVSGPIGDAAFGLLVAQGKAPFLDAESAQSLLDRYRLPTPRTTLGPSLVGLAHAAMDISDGLVGDLGHICRASAVGALVEVAKVPLSTGVEAAITLGVAGIEHVLTGGDDYELLFTANPDMAETIGALGQALGLRITKIGRMIAGEGVRVMGADGRELSLAGSGYRHFSG
jgi:thiamine-monophosphate kinase